MCPADKSRPCQRIKDCDEPGSVKRQQSAGVYQLKFKGSRMHKSDDVSGQELTLSLAAP